MSDLGASVYEWVNVVRRARLHATTKLIALLLATYADPAGTRIYPGIARLAIQSGHGYRTVQRELARLRAMGLIERLPRAGARRGWSDGYRLILGEQLLEKVDVPTPAIEEAAVASLTARYRGKHRKTARHPDGAQTPPVDNPVDNPSAENSTARHSYGAQRDDCTPYEDATARHGQPADQAERHRILHRPLPKEQPSIAMADHRDPGTGSARAYASDESDSISASNPRTREGTDRIRRVMTERMRQAGLLDGIEATP